MKPAVLPVITTAVAVFNLVGNAHVAASPDVVSLLQARSMEKGQPSPKNLVLFFDGAFQNRSGNLWKIAQHSVKDEKKQVVFYKSGSQDIWGTGIRQHAMRGYKFLSENYNQGDQIFVFAQSRGCASARNLQGLLHRFGLAERSSTLDWDAALEDPAALESILTDGAVEVNTEVDVQAMVLVDAVLRAMWEPGFPGRAPPSRHFRLCSGACGDKRGLERGRLQRRELSSRGGRPFHDLDLRPMHLELTPKVRHLLHAMALEEVSDYMQAAELVTSPETNSEQVWFMGDHNLMCIQNDIMVSWLMDRSQELGLLVQDGFAEHLNLAYCQGSPYKVKNLKDMVIRDPGACRRELYNGAPIRIHQSVKDRMENIAGWVPLTECCHPEVLRGDVTWVTNPTYSTHKRDDRLPQWLLMKLRISAGSTSYPLRYIMIMTDHGDFLVNVGPEERDALSVQGLFPYHKWETEPDLPYKGPPMLFMIEGPCMPCPGYPKSFAVLGSEFMISGPAALINGTLLGAVGRNVTVEQETQPLYDDESAVRIFKMPLNARCSWLYANTAQSKRHHGSICATTLPSDYPSTCEQLRTEVTAGTFHGREAATFAYRWHSSLFPVNGQKGTDRELELCQRDRLEQLPQAFQRQWLSLSARQPWLAMYQNFSSKRLLNWTLL